MKAILGPRRVHMKFPLGTDPIDIFHAYSTEHCAWRRTEGGQWDKSTVWFDGELLGPGSDPRIVGDTVAAVKDSSFANSIWRDGEHYKIIYPAWPKIHPGKNYAPFLFHDGRLGLVHSYDPPIVLFESVASVGKMLVGAMEGKWLGKSESCQGYSVWRGGTNGVWVDSKVFGIGHTTRWRDGQRYEDGSPVNRHRPFGWLLDMSCDEIRIEHIEVLDPPDGWPIEIVDPTSLVQDGSALTLWTCEVPHHFHASFGECEVACYSVTLER